MTYAERLRELKRTPRYRTVRVVCEWCGQWSERRVDVRLALAGLTCGHCRKQGYLHHREETK